MGTEQTQQKALVDIENMLSQHEMTAAEIELLVLAIELYI